MTRKEKIDDYNSEPVTFCSKCYSLKVKYEDSLGLDYCMDCGCSDVTTSSIEEWERLYESKYGKKFVTKSHDPKTTYIFNLSLGKLKKMVYESDEWEDIIHALYPHFPQGLSKIDSILLLFDRLIKDNKMDNLRSLLLERGY